MYILCPFAQLCHIHPEVRGHDLEEERLIQPFSFSVNAKGPQVQGILNRVDPLERPNIPNPIHNASLDSFIGCIILITHPSKPLLRKVQAAIGRMKMARLAWHMDL